MAFDAGAAAKHMPHRHRHAPIGDGRGRLRLELPVERAPRLVNQMPGVATCARSSVPPDSTSSTAAPGFSEPVLR